MPFDYLSFDYQLAMIGWLIAGVVSFLVLLKLRLRWKGKPRKLTCVNAMLSLWMFLSMLTLLEIYFAVIFDKTDSFNMTLVSKKWFEKYIRPDQKVLEFNNRAGTLYRARSEYPKSPPPEKYHICFLGDSFTFGHGVPNVEDRFSDQLSVLLEAETPNRFLVSNLADAGTDTHWVSNRISLLIENEFPVNTIVYVMCLNDIETFHERHKTYYNDLSSHNPQFFLFRQSYFFNFAYFRLKMFSVPEVRGYYSFVKEYYDGEPWERMQLKLEMMHEMCKEKDIDFRIVVFPFLHKLGPDYDFHHAHSRIVNFCNDANIPVLDLEPVLSPYADETLTVSPFDAHPNERAHALAAKAIQEKLFHDLTGPAP